MCNSSVSACLYPYSELHQKKSSNVVKIISVHHLMKGLHRLVSQDKNLVKPAGRNCLHLYTDITDLRVKGRYASLRCSGHCENACIVFRLNLNQYAVGTSGSFVAVTSFLVNGTSHSCEEVALGVFRCCLLQHEAGEHVLSCKGRKECSAQ